MSGMGVVGLGNPPLPRQPEPVHILRLTFEHPDHYITADIAIANRMKRFRESKTPFERDGMTLRYSDPHGVHVELTYLPGAGSSTAAGETTPAKPGGNR